MPSFSGNFTSASVDSKPQGDGSLWDSLANFAVNTAKTAATVKTVFSDRPAGTPDVVGEVQLTVPQLAGAFDQRTLLLGAAVILGLILYWKG